MLLVALAGSALVTLVSDLWMPHSSELARRANQEMVSGRYRRHFWWGGIGMGHILPLLFVVIAALFGGIPAAGAVLTAGVVLALGHYLYNTAFVMAPQELPNS